jgi:4'-phosphopantetheinyl transferase
MPEPGPPPLARDEIHLVAATLELSAVTLGELELTLSPDELERADRFVTAALRASFIAARGLLRWVLAAYLDTGAASLRFRYGTNGKPALDPAELSFNLSHSHGALLVAVTRGREIGVDIERVRNEVDHQAIARTVFSPGELAALARLPTDSRARAFFRCWTRKEAFIKGRGDGLSLALDSFDVALDHASDRVLQQTRFDPGAADHWQILPLDVGVAHEAALAAEGHDWQPGLFVLDRS